MFNRVLCFGRHPAGPPVYAYARDKAHTIIAMAGTIHVPQAVLSLLRG